MNPMLGWNGFVHQRVKGVQLESSKSYYSRNTYGRIQVDAVQAFKDNYIWVLHRTGSPLASVVDPGDAKPVIRWLESEQRQLEAILITHHHPDHIGGITELLQWHAERHLPSPQLFGPKKEDIHHTKEALEEPDHATLNDLGLTFQVLDLPGHTLGHIAYYAPASSINNQTPLLFCGDTLFCAGCGRLFEGTAEQMHHSLQKLAQLPDETVMFCTHEYTMSNLAFAVACEPNNASIAQRSTVEQEKRNKHLPTVPSTIGIEKQTNLFLRASNAQIFANLRSMKDRF